MIKNYYGLTKKQVIENRKKKGNNTTPMRKNISTFRIFLKQLLNPIILILSIITIFIILVALYFNSYDSKVQAIIILCLIIFNVVWGTIQELKTRIRIEKLKKLDELKSVVIRDGIEMEIVSAEVVQEDILVIRIGDIVNADIKIIQADNFLIDESFITGESEPINKYNGDIVLANSQVLNGIAIGQVIAVGEKRVVGQIGLDIVSKEPKKSILEKKINYLNVIISIIALFVTILLFLFLSLMPISKISVFKTTTIFLIAIIPEGISITFIIMISLLARKSAKSNALVKDAKILETLSKVDIVCTDKTGTLTKNKMTITKKIDNKKAKREDLTKFIAIPSSSTSVAVNELLKSVKTNHLELIEEITFNSKNKYSAMKIYDKRLKKYYVVKLGAPEMLVITCIEDYSKICSKLAKNGQRILVSVYQEVLPNIQIKDVVENKGFILNAIYGIKDPIKKDIITSINKMQKAGISVIVVTGDHIETAKHIAKELNIYNETKHIALTGDDISKISKDKLSSIIEDIRVVARVSPQQKSYIIELLQAKNHTVAMLGDGTNDVIAITQANIGVAMGSGTEVAKELADMIILDNNFSTITDGIKNGRTLFINIQKTLIHTLTLNFTMMIILLFVLLNTHGQVLLFNLELILLINVILDGFISLALGFEVCEKDIMLEKPNNTNHLVGKKLSLWVLTKVLLQSGLLIIVNIYLNILLINQYVINSVMLLILILGQVYGALEVRTFKNIINISIKSNILLIISLCTSVIFSLVLIYSPINIFFNLLPIRISYLPVVFLISLLPFFITIIIKSFKNKFR